MCCGTDGKRPSAVAYMLWTWYNAQHASTLMKYVWQAAAVRRRLHLAPLVLHALRRGFAVEVLVDVHRIVHHVCFCEQINLALQ